MNLEPLRELESVRELVAKATDTPLLFEKFKDGDSLLTFGNTGVLAGDFRYSLWCGIKKEDAIALAAMWNLIRTHGEALSITLAQLDDGCRDVAWPERMVNLPCPDGTTDRIVGFRVPEGSPIMGRHGLSEPIAWLRSVTVDRQLPSPPAQGTER